MLRRHAGTWILLLIIELLLLFGQINDHGYSENAIFLSIVVFATLVVGGVLITVVHSRKNNI